MWHTASADQLEAFSTHNSNHLTHSCDFQRIVDFVYVDSCQLSECSLWVVSLVNVKRYAFLIWWHFLQKQIPAQSPCKPLWWHTKLQALRIGFQAQSFPRIRNLSSNLIMTSKPINYLMQCRQTKFYYKSFFWSGYRAIHQTLPFHRVRAPHFPALLSFTLHSFNEWVNYCRWN